MTRAVLLPAGSDPFLNAYWLRHYRTWAREVDELHVAVCGPIPPDVIEYTQACVDAVGGTMYHFGKRTRHGQVLTFLLEQTHADYVMLIEDDAFVRRPAAIGEAFGRLERHEIDLLAVPRDSYATANIIAAARAKIGDEPRGLAFWPCFLFTARAYLEATDKVFDAVLWSKGETVLGTTLTKPASADTFVWASYQLRDMGLKVGLHDGRRLGDPLGEDPPWFHVGSLSSGHGWGWQHEMYPAQYAAEIETWRHLPAGEAAKRMAWWQRVWDHWDGEISDYHAAYGAGMRQFMADFGIDQGEVDDLRASFDPLITWAES